MTSEALQVVCATQCSDKLTRQPLAALATDLSTALGLGLHLLLLLLLLILHRVCHGAHGTVGAILRGEALRSWRVVGIVRVGGLSREAVTARVVGVRRRRTLSVHRGRRRRVHGQQRLAGGGRGGCVVGRRRGW